MPGAERSTIVITPFAMQLALSAPPATLATSWPVAGLRSGPPLSPKQPPPAGEDMHAVPAAPGQSVSSS